MQRDSRVTDVFGMLLDALADRIAARIVAAPDRERYSSRELPSGASRRRFAEICRSGRVLDARRTGRDWECSRVAWDAARARRPPVVKETTTAATDLDQHADELLVRAGLRVVRGVD